MTELTSAPQDAVAHLSPEHWQRASEALIRKALAEFSHERLLVPQHTGGGNYLVTSDDGTVEYRFSACIRALNHWDIDTSSITRRTAETSLRLDAHAFFIELAGTLGLSPQNLPTYLEEISATLASGAYKLTGTPATARELALAPFQTIESALTAGHPCFVANSGRLGFDADEFLRYAPEAGESVRLVWLAVHRDRSTFTHSSELTYDELVRTELDSVTLERFTSRMHRLGLDLNEFHLIPVHPWQWWNKLAVTFAADIAARHIVCLGYSNDEYRPQQSVRTLYNTSRPTRHYVKMALSVLNMGFTRGLSAEYMRSTPAINDWLSELITRDETLRRHGFTILRERAAVGYHQPHYEAATPKGSAYLKMLAALWRESPVSLIEPGQRLVSMAALLHVDFAGDSLAAALITESGMDPAAWLRRYLEAYLTPLLHCFYAYDLVFMPHGENIILVLRGNVPCRVFCKDIAEEVAVMDPAVELPAEIERIRVEVPEDQKTLSIFTDVFDSFFRFLSATLVEAGLLDEDTFWATVASCVADYQRSMPHLAARFERYDLFAEYFELSCLNRLQLRDNQEMVDLTDPAGALQLAGALRNPVAPLQ